CARSPAQAWSEDVRAPSPRLQASAWISDRSSGRWRRPPARPDWNGARLENLNEPGDCKVPASSRKGSSKSAGRFLISACSRNWRWPFAPGLEQRKVQREPRRARLRAREQHCITFELPAIALALAIEKNLEISALVRAGLIVHDPAHPVRIDKGSIQGDVDQPALDHAGQAIFRARITMFAAQ